MAVDKDVSRELSSAPYLPPLPWRLVERIRTSESFVHFRGHWPFYSGREVAWHLR